MRYNGGSVEQGGNMIRVLVAVALGAAGGFLYYRFVGCAGGVCPLTSNPYISTLYGAVLGALLSGIAQTPAGNKEKIGNFLQ